MMETWNKNTFSLHYYDDKFVPTKMIFCNSVPTLSYEFVALSIQYKTSRSDTGDKVDADFRSLVFVFKSGTIK